MNKLKLFFCGLLILLASSVNASDPRVVIAGQEHTLLDKDRATGQITKNCPNGWYVSGITIIDNDGGKFCQSCISGIKMVCSKHKH